MPYSWDRKYGLKDTKTHDIRDIPIHEDLYKALKGLISQNPGGYVFSSDSGKLRFIMILSPILFTGQWKKSGSPKRRGKNETSPFIVWRHFFNSMMRGKIADFQLQRLTGHKTQEMTEHYTHMSRVNHFKGMFKTLPEKKPGQVFTIPGYAVEYGEPEKRKAAKRRGAKLNIIPREQYDRMIKEQYGKEADNG